jgi:hypothetical protein
LTRTPLITLIALTLFVLSCASAPKQPVVPAVPEWDLIPAGIGEAVCARLKMDAIATMGPVTIVGSTQPLASPRTVAALAGVTKKKGKPVLTQAAYTNRAIPIVLATGACRWHLIDAAQIPQFADEMIVELSAPIPNPFAVGEAGMFARVSLGGENPSWYWIPLLPSGNGWSAGLVVPLSQ